LEKNIKFSIPKLNPNFIVLTNPTQNRMETITLQIPSLVENLRIVESFIDNIKEQYRITDDIYGNIYVAVLEAVNNAIKHGNKSIKEKNVELSLQLQDETVKFWIKDEGEGFNFQNLPDPTSEENIEKTGGRGVFLMRHLADEVHFSSEGRKVELVFYINA
jgi:serine/threonine-protein kinase RsbW